MGVYVTSVHTIALNLLECWSRYIIDNWAVDPDIEYFSPDFGLFMNEL